MNGGTLGQQLSMQEPCKGQKGRDTLPFPRKTRVGAYHRSLQSLTHTEVKTTHPWVYWREVTVIFQLQGWWSRHGLFYFCPPERHGKPSGNKTHLEQPEVAYTETGSLAKRGAALLRQRHLIISTGGSSPRRPAGKAGEHQVYGTHRTAKLQH